MHVRLTLSEAVTSLLGKKTHENYREGFPTLKAVDLYRTLGLTGSPMLYKYMDKEDITLEPERARVFYDKFEILISDWATPEELIEDCTNKELGAKIAYEPIKEIVESLVSVDSIEDESDFRRAIKVIIAKWY